MLMEYNSIKFFMAFFSHILFNLTVSDFKKINKDYFRFFILH